MSMKTLLGKIIDTFAMSGLGSRVLVIDNDCSKDIQYGEMLEVHMHDGKIITAKLLDGVQEPGKNFGVDKETVSPLRVEDSGFSAITDGKTLQGCEVFKA